MSRAAHGAKTELLLDVATGDVRDICRQLWPALSVWSETSLPTALTALDDVLEAAEDLRLPTLMSLTGAAEHRLRDTLLRSWDVDDPEHRQYAHRFVRHLVIVTRGTVQLLSPAVRGLSEKDCRLCAGLKRLPALHLWRKRPLTDDEVAAVCMMAELDALAGREPGPALVALLRLGLALRESTMVLPEDIGHDSVHAHGQHGRRERDCPLDDPWPARILRDTCGRRHHSPRFAESVPLAYTGRLALGSPEASASAAGVFDRLAERAGLTDPSITPMSLTHWRPDYCIRARGDFRAAIRVSGLRAETLLRSLGLTLDPAALPDPSHSRIRDWKDQVVATVPSRDIELATRARRDKASRRARAAQAKHEKRHGAR